VKITGAVASIETDHRRFKATTYRTGHSRASCRVQIILEPGSGLNINIRGISTNAQTFDSPLMEVG
jgi:hypothetical protein